MSLSKALNWLSRHPLAVGLFLLATTAVSAWSATGMKFDFAPQSIFAGRGDLTETAQEFKETFGYDASVIQVILAATGDDDVLQPPALDWQVSQARRFYRLPDVVRVESLGSITTRKFSLSGRLGLEREPLIEVPANDQTEDDVRDFLDHSHLVEGILVGTDRKVAAILVFFDPEMESVDEMREVVAEIQSSLKDNPPPEGYETYITGQAVLRVDIVKNLQSDQRSLIPLAGVLYFLALFLAFRRVSGSLLPLLAIGVGLAWTFGLFAATGQSFNLISNVLPMLLMVLGVSNSVHIISRYAQQAEESSSRHGAVAKTMRHMAVACFLTFITTAAGFASLGTAHSDLIRSFGWQSVTGLVLLYFAILITLTAALPWLKPPAAETRIAGRSVGLGRWMPAFSRLVTARPKLLFAACIALMALAVFVARDVKVNSYTLETYDPSHPTLRTIRLVERRLSGLFPLEIDLRVQDPETFYEADFVKKLAEVQRFAARQDDIVFQRSYLNLHAEVSPDLRDLLMSEPEGPVPELAESIRRSRIRLRTSAEEMGYSAFMTPDKKRARLLLKVRDDGTYQMGQLIDRLDAKLRETFAGEGVSFQMTGDAYVITKAMNQLIRDLMVSLLTASGIIFVIIGLMFRSLRLGLIAALPNITPLVLTLGYMGLRGYDMNTGNVIVFTISLGIAVDDTIHLIYRFLEEHQTEPDILRATRRAVQGTGPAMVLTSALIVGGLAVLLLSEFVPTRRFAELMMVTMGGALIGDLLLLPACLVLFIKRPNTEPPAESEPGKSAGESSQAEPVPAGPPAPEPWFSSPIKPVRYLLHSLKNRLCLKR